MFDKKNIYITITALAATTLLIFYKKYAMDDSFIKIIQECAFYALMLAGVFVSYMDHSSLFF